MQNDYQAPADFAQWTYLDLAMGQLNDEAEAFFLAQDNPEIRQGLAENQTLSRAGVAALAQDDDEEVRAILAENPDVYEILTPDEVVDFVDANPEILAGVTLICNKPDVIARLVEEYANDEDPELRGALAASSELSEETMRAMMQDEAYEVKAGLISNELFHERFGEDFVLEFVGDDPDLQDVYAEYQQLTAMCEQYGQDE